jgi:hypothetical protein
MNFSNKVDEVFDEASKKGTENVGQHTPEWTGSDLLKCIKEAVGEHVSATSSPKVAKIAGDILEEALDELNRMLRPEGIQCKMVRRVGVVHHGVKHAVGYVAVNPNSEGVKSVLNTFTARHEQFDIDVMMSWSIPLGKVILFNTEGGHISHETVARWVEVLDKYCE